MERRTFLKWSGVGAATVTLGSALRFGADRFDQVRSPRLQVLSQPEAEIFGAIADTIFPGESFPGGMPSATDVGIVAFYDDYLASIDGRTQKLLRLLLHTLDESSRLADLSGARFRDRPAAEREEILRAWDRSWFSARRGAYTSLELFIAMGYTEHPAVLEACGIQFHCATEPARTPGVS